VILCALFLDDRVSLPSSLILSFHTTHSPLQIPHVPIPIPMASLPNLQPALKLYNSDKIRDRAQGSEQIREIFSDKFNIVLFQETAARQGGEGWIAFFQCLFFVVVTEKKGVLRSNATAQGELSSALCYYSICGREKRSVLMRGEFSG
jgi:hypothetical protein